MNEFDRRWKIAAATARGTASPEHDEPPFGFATRVVARWQSAPAAPIALVWQRLALRILSALALVLAGLAIWSVLLPDEPAALRPTIEDAVAESFWIL